MTSQVKLPDIQMQGIYAGKFKDWNPSLAPAGKLTSCGDTALQCMKPKDDRPPSPDVIRKFRATVRPDAGQMRVFYGRAGDPHQQWAENMTHGINTQPSDSSGAIVNPAYKTLFQQRLFDRKERIYSTHQRAPLGKSHDQSTGLPRGLNRDTFTFGVPTELDSGAGGLINPNKTYAEVENESVVGHELYKRSHTDFDVGERHSRGYVSPGYESNSRFGIPTPHHNDGLMVKTTMKWQHETQQEKASKIVSKRVDEFREKTQPQLGQVHDPIKDTLKVAPDHTFGILVKPDEYGAGDLLHQRTPGEYLRGKDRQRGILAAIRQHLKKANYHNFDDLVQAFKFYDKENKGCIDIHDLREACLQYHLPVEPELLEQLLYFCDSNKDGNIDYIEFANFLNWKDKMKSGFPEKTELEKLAESRKSSARSSSRAETTLDLANPSDLQPKSPQSAESTPRVLQKQIDKAIGDHRTQSSMINAVVGGVSTQGYRAYGVPTIRTDLRAPRIKRVCDTKNYGDESDAYGLVNPSIFSRRGVQEKDFLLPRSKEEIQDIFTSVGVLMTGENFEQLYRTAASQHPKGHVSVESFRSVLDDIQAQKIASKEHPLAV